MPSFGNRCGAVLDPNALAALNALLRRQRRCWQDIQQQQPPPGQQQQQHQQQQQPPGQQHEAEHKASQVFRDAIDVNTDVLAIVRARKRQRLAAEAAGAASPLLPLPKRYRKVSSQETAQDREHLQALLKDAQHCVSLLTQSASDAANGSAGAGAGAQRLRNDTDGVAGHDDDRDDRDAQAELHITSQTLAVNRPQTLEQLAVLLCQLARSSCNTADGAGCPVPDSLLVALPDDDCLAVMQQTLGGQEPPKAGMELSDESSGRMARWLLLDKFAALDRAPGRTLASAFRIAAKTRPQPTMEALVIHLLSLYADRKGVSVCALPAMLSPIRAR
ncbi:hypothetical protein BC831DRAFT_105598 [Entophlyctis helioformis]|nr:hypothetical protein BC831DRAFT_105598 [Entophlyctis helioformis]